MSGLSRRGFLALGGTGAAAAALAACGAEEEDARSDGDDDELLTTALEAEAAYALAARGFADQQGVSAEIEKASAARLDQLETEVGREEERLPGGAGDPAQAAAAAIAAYRQGARSLSTVELRRQATQFLGQVAGELAALRELNGEAPVPFAFATGLGEEPLESADDAPSGDVPGTTTTNGGGG